MDYSHNHRLKNIYAQLDCQHRLFIATILNDMPLAERSYLEHRTILHAIEERDVAAAQDAIKVHYQTIKQYYINKLIRRIQI